jgi:hypothetical protein
MTEGQCSWDKTTQIGQPRQDSHDSKVWAMTGQDRSGEPSQVSWTGQPRQVSQDRTESNRLWGQVSWGQERWSRTAGKGPAGKDIKDRAARNDSLYSTARKGSRGQDDQNMTTRTGQ